MKFANALFLFVGLSVATGCTEALPSEDGDSFGQDEAALAFPNALFPNALFPNALFPNALFPNALFPNALFPNALEPDSLAAIQGPGEAGDLSRMFVRYAVACSFRSTQSFVFSWTDAGGVVHDEQYPGALGIAPGWATGPLNEEGQKKVSACLGALTNYYGVHVLISLRSGETPLRLPSNSSELVNYPHVEGAFWGNLFSTQPSLNGCFNSANIANSRAHQRDCATGHVNPDGTIAECGIIDIVGSCASVCKKYNASRGYYEDCREKPGSNKRTDLVITTALP